MQEAGAAESWDLQLYLREIGWSGEDSVAVLAKKHLQRFKYCNADLVLQGRLPVAERELLSDAGSSLRWMLKNNAGICFQHNEVFLKALLGLGFKATVHNSMPVNLFGDVIEGEEEFMKGRAVLHTVVLCQSEKQTLLVDVGYASNALYGVLDVNTSEVQMIGDETYRIFGLNTTDKWKYLQTFLPEKNSWFTLYIFELNALPNSQAPCNATLFAEGSIIIRDTSLRLCSVASGRRKLLNFLVLEKKVELQVFEGGFKTRNEEPVWTSAPELQKLANIEFPGVDFGSRFVEALEYFSK